ncbi:glutamate--tRNA ligase [Longispora fulva]|uniref:Glutamate--tRNA ligase n=1 Tax=Longispora fulva TaxID=619741 RepID=A0A8J7KP78_9ACTN|nr:glutamate--tRNA ligase [Longispora fulva]MBG6141036.1 glutamyl-tRNA synthetase [Longispora fulva]GIG60694.1 glutamate--tRNA ligase [Longispora fulva]
MSDLRLRFSPSPTGTPHVGLMRTALYNWAHARHHGGKLVFRIEDTDAARDSDESYQMLLDAMSWLGLDYDEGPDLGGPYGPYRQSERSEIYRDVAAKLFEAGYAYESYSTPEEIEARHKALGRDPKLGYDGFDRNLTAEQVAAFKAEGREAVLRIRMPDEDVTWVDAVRGEVTFKAGSVPDYVIVRGNGQPLYTLTNPVDDAMMRITMISRGEDLLSSTPRQIVLFKAMMALGIAEQVPEYAHLPLVTGEGNKKLSKRDPRSNFFAYRDAGYLPEGLANYLALLGWAIAPDRDIFTMAELISAFDLHNVNSSAARFDEKKCEAINAEHVRRLDPADFADRIRAFLPESADPDLVAAAAPLIQTRITTLAQARDMLGFLFSGDDFAPDEAHAAKVLTEAARPVLEASIGVLEKVDWTTAALEEALKAALIDGLGLKPKVAFAPLRVAVTGRTVSPPLYESMELLGRETTLERLRKAL